MGHLTYLREVITQEITDGTYKGTASNRVTLTWEQARQVLFLLSSLEALQAENAELKRRSNELRVEHDGLRRSEREWRIKQVATRVENERLRRESTAESSLKVARGALDKTHLVMVRVLDSVIEVNPRADKAHLAISAPAYHDLEDAEEHAEKTLAAIKATDRGE